MKTPKYVQNALSKMSLYMDKANSEKSIVIEWLEKQGIDYSEECEYLEANVDWVYGIDMERAERLIIERREDEEDES